MESWQQVYILTIAHTYNHCSFKSFYQLFQQFGILVLFLEISSIATFDKWGFLDHVVLIHRLHNVGFWMSKNCLKPGADWIHTYNLIGRQVVCHSFIHSFIFSNHFTMVGVTDLKPIPVALVQSVRIHPRSMCINHSSVHTHP